MRKINFLLVFLVLFTLSGCELFKLTEKRRKQIPAEPSQSIGSVVLLVNELKTNNIEGSLKLFIMADSSLNQDYYFELKDKVERLRRTISNRNITFYTIDTLNLEEHLINVEFDYMYEYFFITKKQQDIWLIRNFGPKKE